MTLKPYLQLVRLPNLFTAAADSLAGYLIVGGALGDARGWLPRAASSMAIYAAGIALNDAYDFEVDLRERPGRPLPSGRVSRRFAFILGFALLAAGPAIMAAAGTTADWLVASALAACVWGYDAGLKRTPLGPWVMGSCRGLNLALGLAASADFGGTTGLVAAGSLATFVAGITYVSRSETEAGPSRGVVAGVSLQAAAVAGLILLAFVRVRSGHDAAHKMPTPGLGVAILAAVALVVGRADRRAIVAMTPVTRQRAVKAAVLSLVWLDAGLVASIGPLASALAVAACWIPAFLLGRWLYST